MKIDYEFEVRKVQEMDGIKFPAKSFSDLVLRPGYDNAKTELLEPMMSVNRAHLLMLLQQDLIKEEDAKIIAKALQNLDISEYSTAEYTGEFEDLFFEIEHKLLDFAGDIAGNLHLARSRNDMCVSMFRMVLRKRILNIMQALQTTIDQLLALAKKHENTVTVLHTHTQQAQISTIGHYLLGVCQLMQRDLKRFKHAFKTVNRSSMGACAITTTGFNIDREKMVELLAFDDLAVNSYDAIGGADYLGETATSVMLAAIDTGKVVQDFLLWATQEFNIIRAADPYVQVSSIMPQKRNPVSIEHLRSMLSSVVGSSQTMLTMLHNTPYGDIVDTEDDAQPCIWRACDTLKECYTLLGNVMTRIEINKSILLERAYSGFAGITELADTLVRETGATFKQAHGVASDIAKESIASGKSLQEVDENQIKAAYEKHCNKKFEGDFEIIKKSLDPLEFINKRNITGGCGPIAMESMFSMALKKQKESAKWLNKKQAQIFENDQKLNELIESLL